MSTTLVVETSEESHAILRNGVSYVTQLQVTLSKHGAVIEVVNSQGNITSGHITIDRDAMIKMAQKILTQDYRDQNIEAGEDDDPHDYLNNSGACPICKSLSITADPIESESGAARGEVHCKDCGADWTDYYTLTGYEVDGDD